MFHKISCTPLISGKLLLFLLLVQCTTSLAQETIHNAAKAGDTDSVKRMLSRNPDLLNLPDKSGLTPLHYAAAKSLETVTYLVEKGAMVNAQSKNGATPLYTAARFGQTAIAQYLLEHKADINIASAGGSVMHQAVYRSPPEMIGLLLSYKPDLSLTDQQGQTLVHVACIWNAHKVLPILIAAGVDLGVKDKSGNIPLHDCMEFADSTSRGSIDCAKLLLEQKVSLNEKNKSGLTPLALARKLRAAEMEKLLLDAGALE